MAVDSLHLLREEALAGNGVIADDAPTLDVEPHVARADEPTQDLPAGEPEGSVAAPVPMQASPPHGDDPFTAGRTLCGRYLIEGRVGGGGSAVVLRARDLGAGEGGEAAKEVAIKVLRPALRASEAAIERLQREFHRLRQLSHPGIVRVFELDRHEGQWFQVMELLLGDSLATLMSRPGGHPTEAQALALLADCADALAWAHARGFVHGDIKPGNIFVRRDGHACLLDFGARDGGDDAGGVDGHRTVHATPAYASPQVLTGLAPEPRDDTFSFACVAFELLTGRHPFDRMNAARARDAGACIADVPYLDARRAGALAAGLSFEREGRPGDVRELVSRITVPAQQVLVPEPARAAPPDERGELPRSPSGAAAGPTGHSVAMAAILAALVAAGAWQLLHGERMPASPAVAAAAVTAQPSIAAPSPSPGRPGASSPETDSAAQAPPAMPIADDSAAPPGVMRARLPAATQRLSFASAELVVSRQATFAAIPLRRTGGADGRAQLAWRLVPGSAQPGRDYTGPASGEIAFADGQGASTLFVPLAGDAQASGDRSFVVTIERVGGAAESGEVAAVEVTLRPVAAASGDGAAR